VVCLALARSSMERVIDNGADGATVYFSLADRGFIAFDSPIQHGFDFTPSTSILVRCDDEDQEVLSRFVSSSNGSPATAR
jgi:predicted 3-demethylubiquinone-9 3-methyltransferase (glyoxalase superfamily)